MTASTIRVEEAAAYLGCSGWKMRQMAAAKEIPCIRIGKKILLFRRESLDEWMYEKEQASIAKDEPAAGKVRKIKP
jgi:excisionase family DNA binding protein